VERIIQEHDLNDTLYIELQPPKHYYIVYILDLFEQVNPQGPRQRLKTQLS
jgi:hypothetical protein